MRPIIANNKPVKVEMTEGEEYYFCACGYGLLNLFSIDDLATWHKEMALLSGVKFSGLMEL